MNKLNMNTDLMYNFKWTKLLELRSTLYVQKMYNSRSSPPTPASWIVQCLYNPSLFKSNRGEPNVQCLYNPSLFKSKRGEPNVQYMYIWSFLESSHGKQNVHILYNWSFLADKLAYNFSSTAFSKVQRTITDFCVVQSAKRVYKTFAGNCTRSTTEENQHFRIVQQIQLFAQV